MIFYIAEYDGTYSNNNQKVNYPNMKGTTDYLRQAASSDYWPEDIIYDPENDGTPIRSLGVNEHWNNPIDKQYSKNLGLDKGIELFFIDNSLKILHNSILYLSGAVILMKKMWRYCGLIIQIMKMDL